ncbi:MAG: type II toxin-antitoxin system RelE/ParE family toxin [Desulfobacteraceae bacterium]|nr:type II toxin-antitoxin system RelE/ParE family toxin [Desulfobacteraceae bacterium]
MKIRILQSAKADLVEGYHFYESQLVGIGMYFLESIYSDIDSLKLFAGIHPIFYGKYYRLMSKRFPFAIYYLIEDNEIRIYSVLDCRRDPAWIKIKLQ